MYKMITAALAALLSAHVQAAESPFPKGQKAVTALPPSFTTGFDFEGIVGLNNCSGSLIQLEGASDTEPALVLTNGHCLEFGMPSPGEVRSRRPSSRSFTVLDSGGRSLGRLSAQQLVYATMTKTDMAIYKVRETYAQIFSRYGVRPFLLASARPQIGTGIEVVSGYWKRGYRCSVEQFIHRLDEGGYSMSDSIRYSRPGCEVIGGTSGSPIIMAGTRTVVGVNNTGNEDGDRCTMNNPCEIDDKGNVSYTQGFSYGQQTYWVYSCLNAAREIDLSVPGCQLPH